MTGRPMPGQSAEMYLKSVLELGGATEPVPISALAERLGVSPISATERVHRLERQTLLEHLPYQGVQLTRQGKAGALRVLRRHRLWERFLHDHLGLPWDRVHDMACQLEHAVGDEVVDRLAVFLGDPEACPHGNPIPDRNGGYPRRAGTTLAMLQAGAGGRVLRVEPESSDLLARLEHLGLRPGVSLRLERHDPSRGAVFLRSDGRGLQLPWRAAMSLFVEVES